MTRVENQNWLYSAISLSLVLSATVISAYKLPEIYLARYSQRKDYDRPRSQKEEKMKKTVPAITALLALLLLTPLAACSSNAELPNVTNKSLSNARSALNDKGFEKIETKDSKGHYALDGTVIDQSPKAGTTTSTSDTVTLTLKTAADTARIIKQTAEEIKGKPATEALDTLKKINAVGTIHTVSGSEITEKDINADAEDGIVWVVTDTTHHTILSKSVDIVVDTESNVSETNTTNQQKRRLESKLTTTAALAACRAYGKQQYPYGFRSHDIVGVIQDFTPQDDNTWFYKATVDVINAHSEKIKGLTYECSVTGTTENPEVVNFNVY